MRISLGIHVCYWYDHDASLIHMILATLRSYPLGPGTVHDHNVPRSPKGKTVSQLPNLLMNIPNQSTESMSSSVIGYSYLITRVHYITIWYCWLSSLSPSMKFILIHYSISTTIKPLKYQHDELLYAILNYHCIAHCLPWLSVIN